MKLNLFKLKLFQRHRFNKVKIVSLILMTASVFSPELLANDQSLYTLPRIGGLIIGSNNIGNIQIVGVVVGLRVDTALYVESELNMSVSGGEYFSAGEKGQLTISNLNLYGVYRYVLNTRYYGKLKAGVAYKSLKYDISNSTDVENSSDGVGGAIGLGVGIVFFENTKPIMMELEYAIIDKDIDMFTVGMALQF